MVLNIRKCQQLLSYLNLLFLNYPSINVIFFFLFMEQVPMKGNLEIAIVFFITLKEINDIN